MRKFLTLLLAPLLVFATLGLGAEPATAASSQELQFLTLLNNARRSNGLSAMVLDSSLSYDARRWSSTMGSKDLLYHTPNSQMIAEVGRVVPDWIRMGENVGVGYDIPGLHQAFWNSPPHRANMLSDFNKVGIGVVYADGKTWVTFRFVRDPSLSTSGTTGGTSGGTTSPPPPKPGTRSFPDVPDNAYFADAVAWMKNKDLTTGAGSSGLYLPNSLVTRGQMATFLWRIAGSPSSNAPQFGDVAYNAFYARAVRWMRAKDLTTGVGGTNRFAPNLPVTREQMAAFLHRFAGEKSVIGRHPFGDVPYSSYADEAITWLHRFHITTGVAPGRFSPGGQVTRAQMAAFLHRMLSHRSSLGQRSIKIRL